MTRREDLVLAGLIIEALTITSLGFLLWCYIRGFDPSMCEAYGACGWRHA